MDKTTYDYIGIVGYYWFATTITSDPSGSWSIGFDSFSVGKYSNNRYFGFSIRLIYSDQIFPQEVIGATQLTTNPNQKVVIGQL